MPLSAAHQAIARADAINPSNPGRSDISPGQRVFHSKFGYGIVAEIEGNKLEIVSRKRGASGSSTVSSAWAECWRHPVKRMRQAARAEARTAVVAGCASLGDHAIPAPVPATMTTKVLVKTLAVISKAAAA